MYEILDFSKVYNSIKDEQMSIKSAYNLTKLIKKIEEENNFYNNSSRMYRRLYIFLA